MKVTSKLFVVALILSLILTVSAVAASEDITFDQSDVQAVSEETNMELNGEDNTVLAENVDEKDSNSPLGGGETQLLGEGTSRTVDGTDFKNITTTINSAQTGDTIFLGGKNYTGNNSQITVNKNNLTIIGGSSIDDDSYATLDAQGLSRILYITASNVVIKNIKFINAFTTNNNGGAILWNGANGTVENCEFTNNSAPISSGGAIGWGGENGKIINSKFIKNNADTTKYYGGAIYAGNTAKNLTITDSEFINNTAAYGGAIYLNAEGLKIINSDFNNNSAVYNGGSVYLLGVNSTITKTNFRNTRANYGALFIHRYATNFVGSDLTFSDNFAKLNGAGIYSEANNTKFINSKFDNNIAGASGAAIYLTYITQYVYPNVLEYGFNAQVINSNFTNNYAFVDGIVHSSYKNTTISGCYFFNNTAARNSAAIHTTGTSVNTTIDECTFENNTGPMRIVEFQSANGKLTNLKFKYNKAGNGIYIHPQASNTLVDNCIFEENDISSLSLHAPYCNLTNLIFRNNHLSGNYSESWGAFGLGSGAHNSTIRNCLFENNSAPKSYGAGTVGAPNCTMNNLTFKNNFAGQDYGALLVTGANCTLTDSKFINNTAIRNVGGLAWNGANGLVDNCIFENNNASEGYGGGLSVLANSVNTIVANSQFNNNFAGTVGGALTWDAKADNGTLRNSKFRNNNATSNGGAVRWNGPNGLITGSDFINNTSEYSGAIYLAGANCTVDDSHFIENHATVNAGVMHINGANGTVNNCEFISNTAEEHSGAITINAANCTLKGTLFENNVANHTGAVTVNGANSTIDDCEFINNQASNAAGAVRLNGVNGTVVGSEFFGNSASDGGAILMTGANGTVDDCDFNNNNATNGGAIHTTGESITIKNSRLVDNEAKYSGNAIWVDGVNNTIMSNSFDNRKSDKPAIHITNDNNVRLDGNGFAGNKNEIAYAEIVIDVADRFIGHMGQTVVIPVYVHDTLGNPLSGEVSLAGYNSISLVEGKANLTMIMPSNNNIQTLVVLYSSLHKIIQVVPADTNNPIEDIVQPSGDTDQLEIDFPLDATGNVTVIINGKEYYGIVKDGKTIVDLKDAPNGNYQATVIYSGDGNYSGMTRTVPVTVKNSEINPTYKISENKDISVVYSGKATVKVLITKNGKPVAGDYATINFNGKNTVVKTDAKGYATLNLNTNIKVATYPVKVTYKGVSTTNKVKITQVIKASNKKVKKSAKATKIKITLNKVNGKFLSKKTLKIKFNKKTYKVKTNKKGVATWNVKKSMLKKLKVGKKVKYTVTYGKATLTKKLTIKK